MTIEVFWKIIDDARQSAGKLVDIPPRLVDVLGQMEEREIIDFQKNVGNCLNRAYDGNLWLAAVVILSGCGDDTFMDFRYWLIAQGREAFEAALVDPDSMADIEDFNGDHDLYPLLFNLCSVSRKAFCKRLGVDDRDPDAFERFDSLVRVGKHPGLKNQELLETGSEEAKAMFPRLAARFGDGIRSEMSKKSNARFPDSPFHM